MGYATTRAPVPSFIDVALEFVDITPGEERVLTIIRRGLDDGADTPGEEFADYLRQVYERSSTTIRDDCVACELGCCDGTDFDFIINIALYFLTGDDFILGSAEVQ